jgi:UDP-N-acetylglucosamine--N-acetylmuramyl-(pentapeptide) pyrophosphoryl-undecaprenol N-acetylglucosamine transferase
VPLVLTEADSHLGLTNRLLRAARASRVPGVRAAGPRGRALPRDRPSRAGARATRAAARESLGVGEEDRLVLVFGGSLGARTINHAAPAAFATRRIACCTSPAVATPAT